MAIPWPIILPLVEIGFNLFGRSEQDKALEQAAESEEAIRKFNSAQTRREAERVRQVGAEDEFQIRADVRRQLARNRVGTAAAGVIPSIGTPLDTELLVIRDAASDIAILEEDTRLQARELDILADFQLQQATDVRKAGVIQRRANVFGGIGDVFGGIGDIIARLD